MAGLINGRVQDFALLIGHVWRCTTCRNALLERPEAVLIGFKLDEAQRERVLKLSEDSFQTMMKLVDETGLSDRELNEAIDHPRARLRHLNGAKSVNWITGSR
ncbi:MAG: hypothetical protein M3Q45_12170 [Chloroflexota bacterium]|nr:hypothetical protein [Chloroflexota bacterium]